MEQGLKEVKKDGGGVQGSEEGWRRGSRKWKRMEESFKE